LFVVILGLFRVAVPNRSAGRPIEYFFESSEGDGVFAACDVAVPCPGWFWCQYFFVVGTDLTPPVLEQAA